jgi:soluble lytic murein transglycosylase-like protein
MEKRHKKTLARTLNCGATGTKLAFVFTLFAPALIAFNPLTTDPDSSKITHIVKIVEVAEKPRSRELVKIFSVVRSHRPDITEAETWRVSEAILEESAKRKLDPLMVLAVIQVESGFQYTMVSPVGARGIMQIMPETGKFLSESMSGEYGLRAASFRPEALDDPLLNIRLGVYYLHGLTKQFPSLNLALVAYNAGPAEIQSRLEKNLDVSDEYANLVIETYQSYKKSKPPTF